MSAQLTLSDVLAPVVTILRGEPLRAKSWSVSYPSGRYVIVTPGCGVNAHLWSVTEHGRRTVVPAGTYPAPSIQDSSD